MSKAISDFKVRTRDIHDKECNDLYVMMVKELPAAEIAAQAGESLRTVYLRLAAGLTKKRCRHASVFALQRASDAEGGSGAKVISSLLLIYCLVWNAKNAFISRLRKVSLW